MKKALLLAIFPVFIGLLALSLTTSGKEEVKRPETGKKLPSFTFKTIEGKTVKIDEYLGKNPLIVNFWGSWCPPCRREVPELRKFYESHKKNGLVIISLAVNDNLDDMKAFMKKEPMPWIHALDDDGLFKKWGYRGVPTNVFVDKNGNVIEVKVGALTLDELTEYEKSLFPKNSKSQ